MMVGRFDITVCSPENCKLSSSGSGGASLPNHALSFGTTVLSSEKRMRTNVSKDARLSLYVKFLTGISLLTEARNKLMER